MDDPALHEFGATALAEREGTSVHSLAARPGTYVIAVTGSLHREIVTLALDVIYRHAGPSGPTRVLFWEAGPGVRYDRDVLEYYESNPHKDGPQPREVAVVTNNRMLRMVVAATSIGYRLFTGRRLEVYGSLPEALHEPEA